MRTFLTVAVEPTAATEAILNAGTAEATVDIASIKQMMDAFDPAALLPEVGQVFGFAASVCRVAVLIGPIVLLVLGLAYLFLSPKEANYYFGYRCYYGMGSVQAWRFTQRLAGVVWGGLGLVLTIVMGILCIGFGGKELADIVSTAFIALIWQAALALVAYLTICIWVTVRYDSKGKKRR